MRKMGEKNKFVAKEWGTVSKVSSLACLPEVESSLAI